MFPFIHTLLILSLLLSLIPKGLTMDINHEGREIILQTDIDTVLITTDLSQVRGALYNMTHGLKTVKQNLVADVRNALVKDQRSINKALLDALRANERSISFLPVSYTHLTLPTKA